MKKKGQIYLFFKLRNKAEVFGFACRQKKSIYIIQPLNFDEFLLLNGEKNYVA
jgi:hypothetical protein